MSLPPIPVLFSDDQGTRWRNLEDPIVSSRDRVTTSRDELLRKTPRTQIYKRSFCYTPRRSLAEFRLDGGKDTEFAPIAQPMLTPSELLSRHVTVSAASGVEPEEMEIAPMETVWQVKLRLARAFGVAPERQRLLWRGMGLQDNHTIAACRVPNGAELRLVEKLKPGCTPRGGPPVPRGLLMVPGNRAWRPVHESRPTMPIVVNEDFHPCAMALEFESVADYVAFKVATADELQSPRVSASSVTLHARPSPNDGLEALETQAHCDPLVGLVRLDQLDVRFNTRREATLRIPRQRPRRCWIVAGDEMGHGAA